MGCLSGPGFDSRQLHKTVLSGSNEQERVTYMKNCFVPHYSNSNSNYTQMFDFEKLEVYSKAKMFNKTITSFLENTKTDKITYDQLRRAAFSIMLNIAEGSGRYTKPDRRNFYIVARGSAFECVAIFNYLREIKI
jgi:four helix bundle protein